MPSTYTDNHGIELIADGEQAGTWGQTTNTNFELIDEALDGQVSITLASAGNSGAPNSLAITDGASSNGRHRYISFTDGGDLGATAYVQLTPNDAEKIAIVNNNLSGGRSLILFQGTYNSSNDFELANGDTAILMFDGAGSGSVVSQVNLAFTTVTIDGVGLNDTTGIDTNIVTGTAGSSGALATWNGDGDLVGLTAGTSGQRATLEALLSEQTPYSGDLDSLSETGIYPLTTGASNHWATAAAGDFVLMLYADANTGFQLGFDGDGTPWRRVEVGGSWSTWAPFLNQNQVLGNDTTDLGASQALKLIAYGSVSDGTSGGFTVDYDEGATVAYTSTGTYTVTFNNVRSAATYMAVVQAKGDTRAHAVINSQTTSAFVIAVRSISSDSLIDINNGFNFQVYEKRT